MSTEGINKDDLVIVGTTGGKSISKNEAKQELKTCIEFFISHLDVRELVVLKEITFQMAVNYSDSYRAWRKEAGNSHLQNNNKPKK